jgi:hypothetical protein
MGNEKRPGHSGRASLLILGWPETLVAMIPRWYAGPLALTGIVRGGMIRAGHAAATLIDHETGELDYSDFGRYMTPEGMGRTRTRRTDPEVELPLRANILPDGSIRNLEEILLTLGGRSHITHGTGPLYASLVADIDTTAAQAFTDRMNLGGSMHYDPFKPTSSNCARYVYDLALAAMPTPERKTQLARNSILTPSPLGTVMFGADDDVWRIEHGQVNRFEAAPRRSVLGNFFKWPQQDLVGNAGHGQLQSAFLPHGDDQLLTGTGSNSYFRILDSRKNLKELLIRRTEPDGTVIFEHSFACRDTAPPQGAPLKIVHDTNAVWASLETGGRRYRYDAQ